MSNGVRGVPAQNVERLVEAAGALAGRLGCSADDAVARIERFAAGAGARAPAVLPALVRGALRLRARRNERLRVDLFRDPAWDMLLELLAAHHEERPVSVSSLCFASGVPATTALRYVDRMADDGLIQRFGDFGDQRRVLVTIAPGRLGEVEALVRDLLALAIGRDDDDSTGSGAQPAAV